MKNPHKMKKTAVLKKESESDRKEIDDINKKFIADTLKTFKHFNITDINKKLV